jgi:hypothetical protein
MRVDVLLDAELPTAASSIVSTLAVSLDAQPAKNMKPAIRIASFCIVLLINCKRLRGQATQPDETNPLHCNFCQ